MLDHSLVSQAMRDSAFVWHVKCEGGGFVPRQAMACGRPVIVKKSYAVQNNNICAKLYEDSVNCIDLDLRSFEENIALLKKLSEPSRHLEFCESTAKSFNEKVNFVAEAEQIKAWVNKLRGIGS